MDDEHLAAGGNRDVQVEVVIEIGCRYRPGCRRQVDDFRHGVQRARRALEDEELGGVAVAETGDHIRQPIWTIHVMDMKCGQLAGKVNLERLAEMPGSVAPQVKKTRRAT